MLSVYLLIQQLQISSSQFTYQNEFFWSIYFKSFFKSAILLGNKKNCQANKKIFSTVSTLSIPDASSYFWPYEMTQCLIRHAIVLKRFCTCLLTFLHFMFCVTGVSEKIGVKRLSYSSSLCSLAPVHLCELT